jgi:hypothetical protein
MELRPDPQTWLRNLTRPAHSTALRRPKAMASPTESRSLRHRRRMSDGSGYRALSVEMARQRSTGYVPPLHSIAAAPLTTRREHNGTSY